MREFTAFASVAVPATKPGLRAVALLGVLAACGDDSGATSDDAARDAATPNADDKEWDRDGLTAPNEAGFMVQGGDWYPPLLRRVEQRACPENWEPDPVCRTDADCGDGQACICSSMLGGPLANTCMSAECASDADCEGACLLSYPPSIATSLDCRECGVGLS